jgi:uncharacterized protein YfkK (UPF0435 family)
VEKPKGVYNVEEKQREELQEATAENAEYIIEWIKKKVNLVNTGIINSNSIDLAHYENLLDLYDVMRKKERLSMGELDAVLLELAQMRKR